MNTLREEIDTKELIEFLSKYNKVYVDLHTTPSSDRNATEYRLCFSKHNPPSEPSDMIYYLFIVEKKI